MKQVKAILLLSALMCVAGAIAQGVSSFAPADDMTEKVENIYLDLTNHGHTYDADGFCTYADPATGEPCQEAEEPEQDTKGYCLIKKAGHLQWLANQCLAGSPKPAKLMADIDFTNVAHQVIVGTIGYPYTCEFDGNSHTITLNLTGTDTDYAGVFGCVGSGGKIHHLNVSGVIARYESGYAGSVAGMLNGGTISCCMSDAELQGMGAAGGIVGAAQNDATVENCAFTGKFTMCQLRTGLVYWASNATVKSCYVASEGIDGLYGEGVVFQNCYVKTEKNAAAFSNGEICWKLNGSTTRENPTWRQNLAQPFDIKPSPNPDALPTVDAAHSSVYTCLNCLDRQVYTNFANFHQFHHSFIDEPINGEIPCHNGCGSWKVPIMQNQLDGFCREHSGTLRPAEEGQTFSLYAYIGDENCKIYGMPAEKLIGGEPDEVLAGVPYIISTNGKYVFFEPAETDWDYKHEWLSDQLEYKPEYEALATALGMQGVLKEDGVALSGCNYIFFTDKGLKLGATNGDVKVNKGKCFMIANSPITEENKKNATLTAEIASPFEIGNAEHLYWFSDWVKAGHVSTDAILIADIKDNDKVLNTYGSLSGNNFREWSPIGNNGYGKRYAGTFDGQGHTISGLYINNVDDKDNIGLFASSTGIIKNVGLIDSYFGASYCVGGVCAVNHGKVQDCFNAATCFVKKDLSAGGIVGSNIGSVANCHNVGFVGDCGGAICGLNWGDIANCYYLAGSAFRGIYPESEEAINKSVAQFASGEVAYLLNSSEAGENPTWRQTIGTDTYPVLSNTHGIVMHSTATGLNSIVRPVAGTLAGATKVYNFAGIKGTSVYGTEYTSALAANHPYIFTTGKEYVSFVPSPMEADGAVATDDYTVTGDYGITGVLAPEGVKVYGKDNTAGAPVSIIFTASALKYANKAGNLVKYGKCYIDATKCFIDAAPAVSRCIANFNEGTEGIDDAAVDGETEGKAYNLQGVEVGNDYRGIVVRKGEKALQK